MRRFSLAIISVSIMSVARGISRIAETGSNIATKSRVFRSFSEAREFVRSLELKSQSEWNAYKSGKRPADIPSNPHQICKGEDLS